MKKPIFSVVIPVYNCEKEIGRLLDSILIQDWDKADYEVIICNDNSTDNCMEIIEQYKEKMNLVICNTKERDLHCPGNTRKDGLEKVSGQWVTFIDNDDTFEPGAFKAVWDRIVTDNEDKMICSAFREWDEDKQVYIKTFIGEETWLHGKWYNMNFIKKYNIDFKENLESHEDLYFNNLVLGHLIGNGVDYNYLNKYTYKWIYRPNSLSRSYNKTDHCYIEVYLKDYLTAIVEPYMKIMEIYNNEMVYEFCLNQILMALLHGYFYYQSFIYKNGNNIIKENYNYLKDIVAILMFNFNMSKIDIVNYIYERTEIYSKVKKQCIFGSCPFIELESFKDFIMNMKM